GTPAMGAYWLWPPRMACSSSASNSAGGSKSGKPCERLMAPCCCASADITVKMVVPTWGRREGREWGKTAAMGRKHSRGGGGAVTEFAAVNRCPCSGQAGASSFMSGRKLRRHLRGPPAAFQPGAVPDLDGHIAQAQAALAPLDEVLLQEALGHDRLELLAQAKDVDVQVGLVHVELPDQGVDIHPALHLGRQPGGRIDQMLAGQQEQQVVVRLLAQIEHGAAPQQGEEDMFIVFAALELHAGDLAGGHHGVEPLLCAHEAPGVAADVDGVAVVEQGHAVPGFRHPLAAGPAVDAN